jgi:AraC family transcriptional regulator
MSAVLESGRFLGRSLRTVVQGDLKLADVRYTAGAGRHAHERPYFCLIRRGAYTERYSRRTRECRPMTLVYHPSGEQHAVTLHAAVVLSLNVELGPAWLGWMQDAGLPPDQPAECHGGAAAHSAARLFRALHRGADRLTIESLTAEIVSPLCSRREATDRRMPGWLRDAADLVDAEPRRPLALREVAAVAGVHPVYFAAVFRRFHGCSLGDFVRRRRLEAVRRQLANPELTVAHVAAAAGFADQSHLTRAFKRFTGLTPGRYRTFLAFKTGDRTPAKVNS